MAKSSKLQCGFFFKINSLNLVSLLLHDTKYHVKLEESIFKFLC